MTDQEIKDIYRELENSDENSKLVDGVVVELVISNDQKEIHVDGSREVYQVIGNKRLRVKKISRSSSAVVKGPLPDKITKECKTCGESFEVSKFNPYFTECPECRKPNKQPKVDEVKVCSECGEEFTASRFNPYKTECKACTKQMRSLRQKIRKKVGDVDSDQQVKQFMLNGEVQTGDYDNVKDSLDFFNKSELEMLWNQLKG